MRLHNYIENPSIETEKKKKKSPWLGGTFELINLQILDKNKSLELINYLHNRLALEFEYPELPELIFDRTTGHPSFIQHFLSKLISLVSERILQTGERLILRNDVDHILKENDELKYPQIDNTTSFSKFVYNKMLPNLNGFDWKILAVMIMSLNKNNQKIDIKRNVISIYDDNFSDTIFEGSITRLHATNIISVTKDDIKFRNKFWAEYLEENPNLLDEYV